MQRVQTGLLLVILWLSPFVLLGAITFTGLSREDLQLYKVGAPHSDGSITAALNTIGTTPTRLLLEPGTWTISNDLTIPLTVTLMLSPGTVLNVAGGRTLTITGSLDAPMSQIFGGAGVVAAPQLGPLPAAWFGVMADDATDDTAAWRRAFTAAAAGGSRAVRVPAGVSRITEAIDFQGVSLQGQGINVSKMKVVGNTIRGLYYDGNTSDADVVLEGFHIEGSNGVSGGTGSLIEVKNAKGVTIQSVSVFNTGVYGISLDFVVNYSIRNTTIRACYEACLALKNNSNAGSVQDNWFEADLGTPEWQHGAIYVVGSTSILFSGNAIEGEGVGRGQVGTVIEGSAFLTFTNNFYEFLETNAFQLDTVASGDVTLVNNHIHCQCNFPIIASSGDLAHANIKITDNHFVGVNASSTLFSPGSGTLMFEFRHNTRDQAAGTCVQGFNSCHLIYSPADEVTTFRDGIGLVKGVEAVEKTIAISADGLDVNVNSSNASGRVQLRAAGAEQVRVEQKGATVARLFTSLAPAITSGHVTLHPNWGVGASVSDVVGNNVALRFTVHSGTAAGSAPTITISYNGSWGSAPVVLVTRSGGNNLTTPSTWAVTATELVITHQGTPDDSGTLAYVVYSLGP